MLKGNREVQNPKNRDVKLVSQDFEIIPCRSYQIRIKNMSISFDFYCIIVMTILRRQKIIQMLPVM